MTETQKKYPYVTHRNVFYKQLEVVDVPALVAACTDSWYNQTLCQVNESVVRLGVVQGEYHWHKHDAEDEFFYVVEGLFFIDMEGRTVELSRGQGLVIPKGVMHRPRAPQRTVILMVEGAGIMPTGRRLTTHSTQARDSISFMLLFSDNAVCCPRGLG